MGLGMTIDLWDQLGLRRKLTCRDNMDRLAIDLTHTLFPTPSCSFASSMSREESMGGLFGESYNNELDDLNDACTRTYNLNDFSALHKNKHYDGEWHLFEHDYLTGLEIYSRYTFRIFPLKYAFWRTPFPHDPDGCNKDNCIERCLGYYRRDGNRESCSKACGGKDNDMCKQTNAKRLTYCKESICEDFGGEKRNACHQGCLFWGPDQCFGYKTERKCDGAFSFVGHGDCLDQHGKRYGRINANNPKNVGSDDMDDIQCRKICLEKVERRILAGLEWTSIEVDGKSKNDCQCLCNDGHCPGPARPVGDYDYDGKGEIQAAVEINKIVWEKGETYDVSWEERSCYKLRELPDIEGENQETTMPSLPNVAWFGSGTFDIVSDPMTWPNAVKVGPDATLSGNGLIRVSKTGHGAKNAVTALKGTTTDKINFGHVIKPEFTICSVTRYTDGGTKGRILNGEGLDWLHGQHGGKAGVAYYEGWKTRSDGTNVAPITDWVVMCGTNAGSQLKLVNGVVKGTANWGSGGGELRVNDGWNMPEQTSDFAIAEVMVWDRGLTSEEMYGASKYLMNKLGIQMLCVTSAWQINTSNPSTTTRCIFGLACCTKDTCTQGGCDNLAALSKYYVPCGSW